MTMLDEQCGPERAGDSAPQTVLHVVEAEKVPAWHAGNITIGLDATSTMHIYPTVIPPLKPAWTASAGGSVADSF